MKSQFKSILRISLSILSLCFFAGNAFSQDQPDPPIGNNDTTSTAAPNKFNQTDFGFTTARIGMAFINDWAWYSQDDIGKAQLDSANVEPLANQSKVRDFRVFSSGQFKTLL